MVNKMKFRTYAIILCAALLVIGGAPPATASGPPECGEDWHGGEVHCEAGVITCWGECPDTRGEMTTPFSECRWEGWLPDDDEECSGKLVLLGDEEGRYAGCIWAGSFLPDLHDDCRWYGIL